jgi:dihydrofolate reductase
MRKLIVFNMMTLDGYFEGLNKDISWHRVDEEVNNFIIEQIKTADKLLFGRKTFKVMEDYWPTEKAFALDPATAGMMSSYMKIVFSATRNNTTWENTAFIEGNIVEKIKKMKGHPGKICSFSEAQSFARHSLKIILSMNSG